MRGSPASGCATAIRCGARLALRHGARAPAAQPALSAARRSGSRLRPRADAMRIAFMHRQLAGGGTEADLRRMAAGSPRAARVHVFARGPRRGARRASSCGACRRCAAAAGAARELRARGAAAVARASAGTSSSGFGRTPRQDVVRVGGGTHRELSRAPWKRRAARAGAAGRITATILWLERRMFAPAGHRRVLAVSRRVGGRGGARLRRRAAIASRVALQRRRPRALPSAPARAPTARGIRTEARPRRRRPCARAIGTGFVRKGF